MCDCGILPIINPYLSKQFCTFCQTKPGLPNWVDWQKIQEPLSSDMGFWYLLEMEWQALDNYEHTGQIDKKTCLWSAGG